MVSSGARSYTELRGPLDVANLATLFGLTQQQALAAVTSAPAAVVQRSVARRAYRGTLTMRVRSAEEVTALRQQEKQARQQHDKQQHDKQQQGSWQAEGMDLDAPPGKPLSFAKAAGR